MGQGTPGEVLPAGQVLLDLSPSVQVRSDAMCYPLQNTSENFSGGKIFHMLPLWASLTSDMYILKQVVSVFLNNSSRLLQAHEELFVYMKCVICKMTHTESLI